MKKTEWVQLKLHKTTKDKLVEQIEDRGYETIFDGFSAAIEAYYGINMSEEYEKDIDNKIISE
jgi:hypothetical protein